MTSNNVILDDESVMWIDTDYIYQNLKVPLSTFQQILFSIPSKHRKSSNDFKCFTQQTSSSSCSIKYLVDIYGAAMLCLRVPCAFSDQLLTIFIAKNYICHRHRHNLRPLRSSRSRTRSRSRSRNRNRCSRSRSRSRSPSRSQSRSPFRLNSVRSALRHILKCLEKVGHQNNLLVNGVNQLTTNQSSQFLELSNMLCALRAQNCQILSTLDCLKDAIIDRLNKLLQEIKHCFPHHHDQLTELTEKLLQAIDSVQITMKNEMNNTNSILNNLTSSITNINSTLNNLLSALENLSENENSALTDEEEQKLNTIYELTKEVKAILMGTKK
jgi:Baculovirus polyhedron envelope protein, PEP, C terminus/Baculovirus polyhedron envelope protein, PEP, N terminus